MFITSLGYVIGYITQAIIATYFGISSNLDIFVAASLIPETVFGITNAIFTTALVILLPEHIKKNGKERTKIYLNNIFSITIITLCIIVFFIVFFSPIIIKIITPGFTEQQQAIGKTLLRILAGAAFFYGLTSFTTGILFSEYAFVPSKIFRLIVGITIISTIIFLQKSLGITSVALGTVLGTGFAFLVQYYQLRKQGYDFSFFIDKNDPYLKELAFLSIPLISTAALYYGNKAIITIITSTLTIGSLSIINYAFLIINVPVVLLSGSVTAVLFPYMAEHAAYNRKEEFKVLFDKTVQIIVFLSFPLTLLFLLLSKNFISLLFERGAFTATATDAVGSTLLYFAIGLLPMNILNIVLLVIHTTKKMKEKVILYSLFVLTNIFLCFFLSRVFSYNGIALGITLAYWGISVAGLFIIRNDVGYESSDLKRRRWQGILKIGMATAIMAGLMAATKSILQVLLETITIIPFISEIIIMITVSGIGISSYLLFMHYTNAEEFQTFLDIIRRYCKFR